MKIATVIFDNSARQYDYLLPEDLATRAEVGDLAVVNSPYSGIVPVKIVAISERADLRTTKATKKVEAIISLLPVRELRAKAERETAVRKLLDEKLRKRMEDNKYSVLVDDIEARKLMEEIGLV